MPPRAPGVRASGGQNTACVEEATVTPFDPEGIGSPGSGQIAW